MPPDRPERAITPRSVALGLAGVVVVCAFTPYNDYAMDGTPFVGNNLPLGLVALALLFAVLVNGPLSRYAPRRAFTSGESAVAFSMALVACCIPSSGLLRYLAPALAGPFWFGRSKPEYRNLLEILDLPTWIFPTPVGDVGGDMAGWVNDPVFTGYFTRWTGDGPPPYGAWIVPILTWGAFLLATAGAMACLIAIVRRQWAENERLPFPLAQIELALIARPEPGRWLNASLAGRGFRVTFAALFAVRAWNAMAVYQPTHFPPIPLGFDLQGVFIEPPFRYVGLNAKVANVFPILAGVTYFLSSPVAFSLWAFVIFGYAREMVAGTFTASAGNPGAADEHTGALVAYALTAVWIGRRHWRLVIAQAFRGERPGEAVGVYLPYPWAVWGGVACAAAMVAWLTVAGCTVAGAATIVVVLLTMFLVLARVVAETGLVYTQLRAPLYRPWEMLATYGVRRPVSGETFFLAGVLNATTYDYREPLTVYASHATRLSDATGVADDTARGRRRGLVLVGLLGLALAVGYAVGWGSTLWVEYRYAASLDATPREPINDWGAGGAPQWWFLEPTSVYVEGNYRPAHSPLAHAVGGFGVAGVLGYLRTRLAWWPLHPVGFLMAVTVASQRGWLSFFVGWLAKVVTVRFGGASLYVAGRSVALGLILGDSSAAGFWLGVNLVLHALDVPFHPINVLPG